MVSTTAHHFRSCILSAGVGACISVGDGCEHFDGEAPDQSKEAGGFGVLLLQDMDLHFEAGYLGSNYDFRALTLG